MMCYGYGLRENEVDTASPRFLSLFIRGNIERENKQYKTSWEQVRAITGSRKKFDWEKAEYTGAVEKIPKHVWDKFTIN